MIETFSFSRLGVIVQWNVGQIERIFFAKTVLQNYGTHTLCFKQSNRPVDHLRVLYRIAFYVCIYTTGHEGMKKTQLQYFPSAQTTGIQL